MSQEELTEEKVNDETQEEISGLEKNTDEKDSTAKEKSENNKDDGNLTEEKEADTAPQVYDFKSLELPEGMELDKELTEEFSSAAKEMNLSQAKADKFMGLGIKLSQKIQQRFESVVKEIQENQIKTFETMLNTDPEIGGANLKQSLIEANEAYKTFVSDEAAQVLAETGLNKHPAIVKVFRDIGKQIQGDSIKGGDKQKRERTADDWYPSMKKN